MTALHINVYIVDSVSVKLQLRFPPLHFEPHQILEKKNLTD
jgi:hypothetical protein